MGGLSIIACAKRDARYGKIVGLIVVLLIMLMGSSMAVAKEMEDSTALEGTSVTAFDMRQRFIMESSEWLWQDGLVELAGSNENGTMYLVFDPTEESELPLRSTIRRIVSSFLVENDGFSPEGLLCDFEEWVSEMYDFSQQISQTYDCTIVSAELHEEIISGKSRFVALEEEYISGELLGDTPFVAETGDNNEARFEWEILPIQIADKHGVPYSENVYLFFFMTEEYPDGYCLSQTWLIADQEMTNRLLTEIRKSISINGNEHCQYRFETKQ